MKQISLNELKNYFASRPLTEKMPALFLGHGSPMNAIENNSYHSSWQQLGAVLPRPVAILSVSAHWYTRGTFVLVNEQPKTIHDFYGFPEELYKQQYPAPGNPALAQEIKTNLKEYSAETDNTWGLDHGTWSVIKPMFPEADIPVIQLSIDGTREPEYHYAMAKHLQYLRSKGVLIVGSGNVVHNLRMLRFDGTEYDWAKEFDAYAEQKLLSGDDTSLVHYEQAGPAARYSIPTNDHYLPLLYILGVKTPEENITLFNNGIDLGSVSMLSVLYS